MTSKFLLVISKDYWGTQTSENTAKTFIQQFSKLLDIPNAHITELFGNNVTLTNVKQQIDSFVKNSQSMTPPHLYIYMNGHGNQTFDLSGDEPDGQDELYQLPDGNLTDDTLTQLIDSSSDSSRCRPFICLISDHCSSGSMLDKTQRFFDWVSIGSSLDNQDSFVSGDGNVMTVCLLNVLNVHNDHLKEITTAELFKLLNNEMKNSFIGDLQQCTMNMSNPSLSSFRLFK